REHWQQVEIVAAGGKGIAGSTHGEREQGTGFLKSWLIRAPPFKLGKAQGTTWTQDTQALFDQRGPVPRAHKTDHIASIHQIKRGGWKSKRLEDIHHLKGGVGKSLHLGLGTGIADHALADIDANYLDIRMGIGGLQYPAARTASQIKDTLYIGEIRIFG